MKKFYFLVSGLLLSMGAMAQVSNGGFETWTAAKPDVWYSALAGISGTNDNDFASIPGVTLTINGSTGIPNVQSMIDPAEGASNITLQTFTSSGGGTNLPDGIYGASVEQVVTTTDMSEGLAFQYKTNLVADDTAFVYITAKGAPGGGIGQDADIYGLGRMQIATNSSSWVKDTVVIQYIPNAAITSIDIIFVSSQYGLFNGGTVPSDGSILELDDVNLLALPNYADQVTNIVAADIANNTDGQDLQVTFDAAADEGTVSEYRVFVMESGLGLQDWSGAPAGLYEVVTPDGSANYTHVFTAASTYLADQGNNSVGPEVIVEDIPMDVYVLSVADGTNADADKIAGPSNSITLTSMVSLTENTLEANVFPNPATNVVNFNVDGVENGTVAITSVTGQEVINTSLNGSTKVDVSNLNNGLYIYTIRNQEGAIVKTSKLVIK